MTLVIVLQKRVDLSFNSSDPRYIEFTEGYFYNVLYRVISQKVRITKYKNKDRFGQFREVIFILGGVL